MDGRQGLTLHLRASADKGVTSQGYGRQWCYISYRRQTRVLHLRAPFTDKGVTSQGFVTSQGSVHRILNGYLAKRTHHMPAMVYFFLREMTLPLSSTALPISRWEKR